MADVDRRRACFSTEAVNIKPLARLLLVSALLWAGQAALPGADRFAVVAADRLNVRAQPWLYSEVVLQLHSGDRVRVLEEIIDADPGPEEPTQWTKIAMPTNATVWVSALYVDPATQTVRARRLNVRAGPGENYSVVGRLERGAAIQPLQTRGNWIEITPPPDCFAFVASEYLVPVVEPRPPAEPAASGPAPSAVKPQQLEPPPAPTPYRDQAAALPAQPTLPAEAPVPAGEAAPPTEQAKSNPQSLTAEAPPPRLPETPVPTPAPADTARAEPRAAQTALLDGAAAPSPPEDSAVAAPSAPSPTAFSLPSRRIVRREGIVRRTVSIQAPTEFGLHSPDTGELIEYLHSDSPDLDLKVYHGAKVLVSGEEGMDARWRRTPVLEVQSIRFLP